ncbi:MAG: ribosome biogenesis GTPase Der [Sphingomonadales bacterium]|nr:ribosome biogenesis GTPase Der [Sphingomonadales bacterium]
MPLTVAIIGRPNVGKSTLFNRLVGKRLALVDDLPGVTRDRREGKGKLGDLNFTLFDTAGLEEGEAGSLEARMWTQTERALAEAHIVLMLIDARAGITPLDRHFADLIRGSGKPIVLIANKSEGAAGEAGVYDAFALGLGEPVAVSAEHGEGLADLYQAIREHAELLEVEPEEADDAVRGPKADEPSEGDLDFAFEDDAADPDRPLQLAIVGRPNAGKSTLINRLLGEDRLITGPEAGLTRDSIAIPWCHEGREIRLFDTAGLRRKSKVVGKLEKLSVADALRAVRYAEVVVLLLDADLGFERQDARIAELVAREGRALVIAVNKWDTVGDRLEVGRQIRRAVEKSLPQVKGLPIVQISALTRQGLDGLMPAVFGAHERWNARIATAELNRWLHDVTGHHPPPSASGGRPVKLRYMAQIRTRPPTFVIFVNRPREMKASYLRYLENELRRDYGLAGVPLRLRTKTSKNPYA